MLKESSCNLRKTLNSTSNIRDAHDLLDTGSVLQESLSSKSGPLNACDTSCHDLPASLSNDLSGTLLPSFLSCKDSEAL